VGEGALMGFEKLIDLVVQFLAFFRFCEIIDVYQGGVHLRWGKPIRILEPGLRWQFPFYIDNFITESSATQVFQCATQSLVSIDGKPLAVGVVITYRIHDFEKALLTVHDVRSAICDACFGTVSEQIGSSTWDEIRAPEFLETLSKSCRKLGFKYGIEVERVRFTELAPTRTYRTITGQ
jgi:regulator of protease activity HflC (stomatin/prohibitin superfamily)